MFHLISTDPDQTACGLAIEFPAQFNLTNVRVLISCPECKDLLPPVSSITVNTDPDMPVVCQDCGIALSVNEVTVLRDRWRRDVRAYAGTRIPVPDSIPARCARCRRQFQGNQS